MAIVVKRRVLRGSKMSLSILRIMPNKMNDTDIQEKYRRYYKWFDGKKIWILLYNIHPNKKLQFSIVTIYDWNLNTILYSYIYNHQSSCALYQVKLVKIMRES